jgi:CDP-diglyceride synthetase
MMDTILSIYIVILPVVIAATMSTILVRRTILRTFRYPIDSGRVLSDGKRLFGDNKTWVGAVSLIVISAICMLLWGLVNANNLGIQQYNWLYRAHDNTALYNLAAGALLGLAYIIAELPNSYLKRRQGIPSGETPSGMQGIPNYILDHTDSIFGCVIVLAFLCQLSVFESFAVIIIGAGTHVLVNVLLVITKVKKSI